MARSRIVFVVALTLEACASVEGLLGGGGDDGLDTQPGQAQPATTDDRRTAEAGADDDGPAVVDAGAPPVDEGCDVDEPFTTITPLSNLNSDTLDGCPRLAADELTIFFVSPKGNAEGANWDLWAAKRSNVAVPFGAAQKLANVNGSTLDTDPSVSPDGRATYFASWRGEASQLRLYRSTRGSAESEFGAASELQVGHVAGTNDQAPMVSPDGKVLYFASNRPKGKGGLDILRAPIGADGALGPIERADDLNSSADDSLVAFSADMRAAYFSSNRAGTVGDMDVWVAKRNSVAEPFGAPRNVKELNTPFGQGVGWLSADRCRLYYASSTALDLGALATSDLYVASKAPKASASK